ncbi:MAG: hypothetical protein AB1445_08810 [Bacillota bacterium]
MLTIDLGAFKPGAIYQLRRMFEAYGAAPFREPVRQTFDALAGIFDGEAMRRLSAPGAPGGRLEIGLPMWLDCTEVEMRTLRAWFVEWRNGFAELDPVVAGLFDDLAGLMADALRQRASTARDLAHVFWREEAGNV